MNITLPDVAAAGTTAAMGLDEVEALNKALTAGYGTDHSTFQGGQALRVESLDTVMKSTIQQNEHFKLFNALQKLKATATVDEWTERNSIGGFLGGTTNSETGNIQTAQGGYVRRVGLVKYLMTQCQVSLVSTLGVNIASSETVENEAGALRVLTDAEFLSFEGDSTVVATEFDGIIAQLTQGVASGQVDGGNVLDCQGQSLASIQLVNKAAAQIAGFGNFGHPSHIYMSQLTQADFDNDLAPSYRVPLPEVKGSTEIGTPVAGIRTSQGDIRTVNDVFIRDETLQQPFDVMYPAVATANASLAPASVTPGAPGADAGSMFQAGQAGNYYYLVAGLNGAGQSTGVVSAQVAIAAGQSVTLTINKSAGGQETGYAIYRSRMNGGNSINGSVSGAGSDFRLVTRIAYSGGATTTWKDQNTLIPGTTKAYVLNMRPGADAIAWRQLMPLLKFQLYPTAAAVLPWAQLLFGYLRLAKRRQHVLIKNIVTSGQIWKPFSAT
ncbi:MAG TPA: hypothetical protein VJP88_03195 [Caulobacteraceae bacterium]|nr:hypothetical protein [Caulobacteraceae bacterium]